MLYVKWIPLNLVFVSEESGEEGTRARDRVLQSLCKGP